MIPAETIVALFPAPTIAGKTQIGPMTLAHAAVLEALGVDVLGLGTGGNPLVSAWILSLSPEGASAVATTGYDPDQIKDWVLRSGLDDERAEESVAHAIAAATCTYIPSMCKEVYFMPRGLGWPLELAELMCSEYALKLEDAMRMPLARVLAFAARVRERNGGEHGGPDYWERVAIEKMKEARNGC